MSLPKNVFMINQWTDIDKMNHLGDTNKMVSDTPRTDAECGDYDRSGCWKSYINGECVQSDFARQLERELNAASKERDDALMMLGMYRMKSDEQRQRIKRLEEAGDRMEKLLPEGSICDKAVNAWREAKEAKP